MRTTRRRSACVSARSDHYYFVRFQGISIATLAKCQLVSEVEPASWFEHLDANPEDGFPRDAALPLWVPPYIYEGLKGIPLKSVIS